MQLLDNPVQDRIVQEGIHWFKHESRQIFEIDGPGGTGKSVTLWRIIEGIGLHPDQILPMAYTGQAAMVMRFKGFTNAKSIHSTLFHFVREEVKPTDEDYIQEQKEKDPFHLVDTSLNKKLYRKKFVPLNVGDIPRTIKLMVIDEGYMVPLHMRKHIIKHGIKVLVAGDQGQLPPIGDQPAFLTGEGIHHLTQIMRQEAGNPIIYLAHRARNDQPIHCGIYGNNVMVIEDKDLTNDMVLNIGNVICGTNKTRDSINNNVRKSLNLPASGPVFGDRVICKQNNWEKILGDIALTNGLTGWISSGVRFGTDKRGKLKKDTLTIDFKPDFYPYAFEGIQINYKYLLADFAERNKIKDYLFCSHDTSELFEFAYALTTHSAQGSEYNSGIYIEEFLRPDMQNQLIYTGITRFKQNLIYVKRTRRYY